MTKNCKNCNHNKFMIGELGRTCLRTGYSISITRMFPSKKTCDENFSGWEQKEPGIFHRIILFINEWIKNYKKLIEEEKVIKNK